MEVALDEKIKEKRLTALGDINNISRERSIIFKDDDENLYELNSYQIFNNKLMPYSMHNPYCLENINNFLEKNNKPYIAIKKPESKTIQYTFKCKICGHEIIAQSSYVIRLNTGCSKCSNKARLGLLLVKEKLLLQHPNIVILNTEDADYENCESKLRCLCSKHEHCFDKTWDKLKQSVFPCPICYKESRGGSGNNFWKGGVTELSKTIRAALKPWWNDSVKQTNYRCSITGLNGDIEVHHLNKTFSDILKEALKVLSFESKIISTIKEYNDEELKSIKAKCLELHYKYGLGLVLNKKIHKSFHIMYGNGENTKEQFDAFLIHLNKVGVESIIGAKDFKKISILKETKMIRECKRKIICNETGEIFESLVKAVEAYKKDGISSSTLCNHLKRGSKFRNCKYTFKYYDEN